VREKQWKTQLWPSINDINFLLYWTKSKAKFIGRKCGTKSCVPHFRPINLALLFVPR